MRAKHAAMATAVALCLPVARALPAAAAIPEYRITYQSIDFPGAAATRALGVNRTTSNLHPVEVVGTFVDIQGSHGFLLSGGQYTRLDVPGAVGTTRAVAINARHEIVGTYGSSARQCNFRYAQGTYTAILAPCINGWSDEEVRGINDAGTLVGTNTSGSNAVGFMKPNPYGPTTWSVPGAGDTELNAINNGSVVPRMVGSFEPAPHAVRTRGARFIANKAEVDPLDPFGMSSSTRLTGINDNGDIVGTADLSSQRTLAFWWDAQNVKRGLVVPGANSTFPTGVNNRDNLRGAFNIVGRYFDNWGERGFIATVVPKGEVASPFP